MNYLKINKLTEMAKVGYFSNYIIEVYGNEGPIPHFHFINFVNRKEGCICITEAKYFNHGFKQEILNSKEKKHFLDFLKSTPTTSIFKNNYERICHLWNQHKTNII